MDDEENVTNLMVQQNIRNNQTLNYDEAQVQSTLNEHQEAMETEPTLIADIASVKVKPLAKVVFSILHVLKRSV